MIRLVNCHNSKITEYVDYHLQPIVREIPLILKTSDFLRKLKPVTGVPENSYLVTLDAKSLYTSIPNSKGVKLKKFNSKNFLQTKGYGAMGIICAPSYANIFMGHFERKYLYPFVEGKSLTYFRYIDDTFLIWTGTKNELDQFFKDLNKKHPSIKFDYKTSKYRIVFVDTEIYRKRK